MHRNQKYINLHAIGSVLFILIRDFREVKPLVWYRGTELSNYQSTNHSDNLVFIQNPVAQT